MYPHKTQLCLHLLVAASIAMPLCAEEPPAERRYNSGPLTVTDFQAEVPDPLPKLGRLKQYAYADTDIRFQMSYRYRTKAEGVEATLTDVDIYAVFLSDSSWMAPRGESTLDHEQGHFDITQMYALDALLQIKGRLNDGKSLVGRGEDVKSAAADLNNKLREVLKPLHDRVASAHKEYDRDTRHGVAKAHQAEYRKQQVAKLAELIAELNESKPADTP